MNEKYQIGQTIYFDYKGSIVEAKITRINQKTLSIIIPGKLKGRIGYNSVMDSPIQVSECPTLERSEHKSQKDLEQLMEEVKQEFSNVFESIFNELELKRLKTVRIIWGTRYTYRRLGTYTHFRQEENFWKEKHNLINLSKSLKIAPDFVVKKTLYHELLHIKFHGHNPKFRHYEKKYPHFDEADKYETLLCNEIKQHGMVRIFKLPITKKEVIKKEVKKTKKELIIEKAKELNIFPHYMNEDSMDEYDYRFLEMQIKKHKNM